jgi:probable HAF family extracellular repeat protein
VGLRDQRLGPDCGSYSFFGFIRFQPPVINLGGFLFSGGSYTEIGPAIGVGVASGINNAGQIVIAGEQVIANTVHSGVLSGNNFTTLSVPGSGATIAWGINDLGQVVGSYTDTVLGPGVPYHGFLFRDGSYTTFDVPGSLSTQAFGINDLGQVVGTYEDSAGQAHAFNMAVANHTLNFMIPAALCVGEITMTCRVWDQADPSKQPAAAVTRTRTACRPSPGA